MLLVGAFFLNQLNTGSKRLSPHRPIAVEYDQRTALRQGVSHDAHILPASDEPALGSLFSAKS